MGLPNSITMSSDHKFDSETLLVLEIPPGDSCWLNLASVASGTATRRLHPLRSAITGGVKLPRPHFRVKEGTSPPAARQPQRGEVRKG